MKILIITEYLSPQKNGIATHCEALIAHLKKYCNLTVFGSKRALSADFSLPGIRNFYNKDTYFLLPSFRLLWHLRKHSYDVVHIFSPPAFYGWFVLLFKKKNTKLIISNHVNLIDYNRYYSKSAIKHTLLYYFVKFFVYRYQVRSQALLLHPEGFNDFKILYPNRKTEILPSGINTEQFQYSESYTPYSLLYVGRLAPEKNLLSLLDLFQRLPERYKLTIVGDGPSKEELIAYAKKKKIEKVTFIAALPHDQTVSYYQKSQAFITTSLSETFGLTLLESLACGTPIIYPKCPLFTQLYAADFPHWQFDLQNSEAFIQAVLSTEKFSRAQCRTFAQEHSWEKVTEKMIHLYQRKESFTK